MRVSRVLRAAILGLGLSACAGGDEAVIGSSGKTTITAADVTTTIATTTVPPSTVPTPSTTLRNSNGTTGSTRTTAPVTTTPGLRSGPLPLPTTPVPGRTQCSPAQFSVDVATDEATYRPGQTVRVSATLRNTSGAPCFYTNYVGEHRFTDQSGEPVRPQSMFIADFIADASLAAGATLTQGHTWDQQACSFNPFPPCTQAPPGTYTATVGWRFGGAPAEGSVTFRLVSG